MLKKTTISKLAKLLKIEESKIETAIADEKEVDLEIEDELTVFSKAELSTRDKNKYDEAKKAGKEMLIKELKTKHAVDSPGEDADKFVEAIVAKAVKDANVTPDAKVIELNTQLDAAKKALTKANGKVDELAADRKSYENNTRILSLFPTDKLKSMNNDEFLTIINSKFKVESVEGKEYVVKDGVRLLDEKTSDPIKLNDAIPAYFKERNWIESEAAPGGGRGGKDSIPGRTTGFSKMSEVKKHLDDNKINMQGEEAMRIIAAAQKDNANFDMNS